MKIPKNCLECISKGNYPCNDCIFRLPIKEIADLFGINIGDDKDKNKKLELNLQDTS